MEKITTFDRKAFKIILKAYGVTCLNFAKSGIDSPQGSHSMQSRESQLYALIESSITEARLDGAKEFIRKIEKREVWYNKQNQHKNTCVFCFEEAYDDIKKGLAERPSEHPEKAKEIQANLTKEKCQ